VNQAVAVVQQRAIGVADLAEDLSLVHTLAKNTEMRRRTVPVMLRGAVAHLGINPSVRNQVVSVESIAHATHTFMSQTNHAQEQAQGALLALAICCRHASGIDPRTRKQLLSLIDQSSAALV